MTKNPFINAFSAALYITVVASMMFYGPKIAGLIDDKDNVLAPITVLSLLVLSAAVMGYFFSCNRYSYILMERKSSP